MEQDDGGYLADLVRTCQEVLGTLPRYDVIASYLHELEGYYAELQVYKHVTQEERVPRLESWFARHREHLPEMRWYEFAASAGSTLGIFCLVSSAFDPRFSADEARMMRGAYFPWVQGLHILLDYLVDQEEDRLGGDLNFCFYYEDKDVMVERLIRVFKEADRSVGTLSHASFHRMVCHGLLALYPCRPQGGPAGEDACDSTPDYAGGRGASLLFFSCLLDQTSREKRVGRLR